MKKVLFFSILFISTLRGYSSGLSDKDSSKYCIATILEKVAPLGDVYQIDSVIKILTSSDDDEKLIQEMRTLRSKYPAFNQYVSFIERRNRDFELICSELIYKCIAEKRCTRMVSILTAFREGCENFTSTKKRYEFFHELFSGTTSLVCKDYYYQPKDHSTKGLKFFYELESTASNKTAAYITEMVTVQMRCLVLLRETTPLEDYKKMLAISETITPSL